MRYSVTYTLPDNPPKKIACRPLTTFYTEDKMAVYHLSFSGLNQGYVVTIQVVQSAPPPQK